MLKALARAIIPRSIRNWLRTPSRTLVWAWDDCRARAGFTSRLELRAGWHLRSHPGAFRFAYRAQVSDAEQVAEFDQFLRLCRSSMVLFDLGAHFGLFSLAALHYGGSTARAVAVDPSPFACRVVRYQAAANGFPDRLTVLQAAAGATDGAQRMVAAGIGSAGYFVAPQSDHTAREQVQVMRVSVDSLATDVGPPTHLKVDVEGFELEVLRGAEHILTGSAPPLLFLELHCELIRAAGGDPTTVLQHLRGWGFDLYDVHSRAVTDEELLIRPLTRLLAVRPETVANEPLAPG